MNKKEVLILVMIVVAMSTRFLFLVDGVSMLPNFTAVGAIAILGAVHLKGLKKWIFPIGLLWLSDLILNNIIYKQYYDHFQVIGSVWVYGSFALIGVMAYYMMKSPSWMRLVSTSIFAGVLFFLITNFGVWLAGGSPYTKDISGLITCYEAGIPFFRNTVLGNLFYSFVLFGGYEYIASKYKQFSPILTSKKIA